MGYFSKTLSKEQRNHSSTDNECLGVHYATVEKKGDKMRTYSSLFYKNNAQLA